MRKLLLALSMMLMIISHSQTNQLKKHHYILTGVAELLAGSADGLNQALQFRYPSVKRTFPGMRDQWWNPTLSSTNKYKNGDPAQGPRFLGSKTWLVFLTDGYHATRFTEHLFNSGAIAIYTSGWEKKKWYRYAIEIIGGWLINRVGFSLVYDRFKTL